MSDSPGLPRDQVLAESAHNCWGCGRILRPTADRVKKRPRGLPGFGLYCQECASAGKHRKEGMSVYDPALIADDPAIHRLDYALKRVGNETLIALDRFPSFNSPHEGLAVLWEEFEELKAHVWASTGRSAEAHKEAIQIAAMAVRYVLDLSLAAGRTATGEGDA